MRLILLAGLLVLPLAADWERHVITPKGDWVDTPESHSLAYFTEDPGLRCEQCDFCWNCSAEERQAETRKVRTEVKPAATLAGFAVYDLFYYWSSDVRTATKSILVKTGVDRYREIYQCTPSTSWGLGPLPSSLVKIGHDQLLQAEYETSGGRMDAVGQRAADFYDYFWFDTKGAHRLDFRPILSSAKAVVPEGSHFPWDDLLEEPDGGGCLWHSPEPAIIRFGMDKGVAVVQFKFDRGRIVVTKSSFEPGK